MAAALVQLLFKQVSCCVRMVLERFALSSWRYSTLARHFSYCFMLYSVLHTLVHSSYSSAFAFCPKFPFTLFLLAVFFARCTIFFKQLRVSDLFAICDCFSSCFVLKFKNQKANRCFFWFLSPSYIQTVCITEKSAKTSRS